jgi:hypothetical protein
MSLALTMLPYEASNTFLVAFLGAAVSVGTPSYEVSRSGLELRFG